MRTLAIASVAATLGGTATAQIADLIVTDTWVVTQSSIGDKITCILARRDGDTTAFYYSFSSDTEGFVQQSFTFQPLDYELTYEDQDITIQIGDLTISDTARFNSNRYVTFFDSPPGGVLTPLQTADHIVATTNFRGTERWPLDGITDVIPTFEGCRIEAVVLSN